MTTESENEAPSFDANDLYLEEVLTDRKVGTIRRMTPVTADGDKDDSRDVIYLGQAQVMTAAGPMPLSFELPGPGLADACAGFGEGAQQAIEETAAKLEEMRREQANAIYVPGQENAGGGKIQL